MRTVPSALIWEMATRDRWQMILMVCAGSALPLLLYSALRYHGAIDPADPSFMIMHVTLVQINMFIFGAGVMTSLGPIKRLYAYPATTSTLVTWQLVPAMVLMCLEMLATCLAMNALFDVQWPLLGTSLFAAVAFAVVVAMLWLTENTAWLPWCAGLVAAVLGLWFKSRHGPLFEQPTHYWTNVTLADAATLLGIAVVAHCVAVYGVARQRRGEPLPPMGIAAWLDRVLNSGEIIQRKFASPAEAQLWCEWQKKGWVMPACVGFGLIMGGLGWLIFSRNLSDMIEGLCFGGGAAMPVIGMLGGLILGNSGPNDANYAMGPFLSTRPMTNAHYARILLWTAAKSVIYAWFLWAIPAVLLFVSLLLTGTFPMLTVKPTIVDWWWSFLPGALLGPWLISTCLAGVMLTGRSHVFVLSLISAFVASLSVNILTEYTLTQEQRLVFWQSVFITLSTLAVVGTIWLFIKARRQGLIDGRAMWASLTTCVILIGALMTWQFVGPSLPLTVCVTLLASIALIVAPIAGTPLALAWNRTR